MARIEGKELDALVLKLNDRIGTAQSIALRSESLTSTRRKWFWLERIGTAAALSAPCDGAGEMLLVLKSLNLFLDQTTPRAEERR